MKLLSALQKKAIRKANKRWNIFSGAVRASKSYTCDLLVSLRIRQFPTGNMMLIGKTERTLSRNVLDPMREMYGNSMVSNIYGDGLVDIFGRRFYVVGANDARAITKIQGIGLVYAMGDEVATWPEPFFNMLKSRLSEPGAIFDGTCNPEGPGHWLKAFIDNTIEKSPDTIYHQKFTIDDNPFLDKDFVKALKTEYTGMWYKRYILGLWVVAEGVIWDMFNEKEHVVSVLPEMKRYLVGVDYGTSNATVFLLIGEDVDGNYYVVKEYYHAGGKGMSRSKTDIEYATDFIEWLGDIVPDWILVDPSAKSFRVQLWKLRDKHPALGKVHAANNDVIAGIRRVGSMFAAKCLFIHKSCVNTIREVPIYLWDSKASERGEDKPIKENDHAPDALRYPLMSIPDVPVGRAA